MQRYLLAGLAAFAIAALSSPSWAQQNGQENQSPATRSLRVAPSAPHAPPAIHRLAPVAPHGAPVLHAYNPAHAPHPLVERYAHGGPNNLRSEQERRNEALRNERLHPEQHAALRRDEEREAHIREENARIERERAREIAHIRDERWQAQQAAAQQSAVSAYAPASVSAVAPIINRYGQPPAAAADSPSPASAASGSDDSGSDDASADDSSSDDSSTADSDSDSGSGSDQQAQDPKAAAIGAILNLLDKH